MTSEVILMRCVIKLGGGILQDEESYRSRARGIEDLLGHGDIEQLVVVVSAMKGRTAELVNEAGGEDPYICSLLEQELKESGRKYGPDEEELLKSFNTPEVAAGLLQGEIDSAYALGKHLPNGIVMEQANPSFPIIGNSHYLCGEVDMDATCRFAPYLKEAGELVILSGFGCIDHKGHKMLLGSNATDYSAAIAASMIGADQLIYLKDVDGIYEGYGTDEQRKIEQIVLDGTRLDVGEVLHPKVARPLQGQGIDLRVGHVEDLYELASGRQGYGTRIIIQ